MASKGSIYSKQSVDRMLVSCRVTPHSEICRRLENNQTTVGKLSILIGSEDSEERLKNIKMKECTEKAFDKILYNEWMENIGIFA